MVTASAGRALGGPAVRVTLRGARDDAASARTGTAEIRRGPRWWGRTGEEGDGGHHGLKAGGPPADDSVMTLLPLVVVLVVLLIASTALALGLGRTLAAGRRIDRADEARSVPTAVGPVPVPVPATVPVRREIAAPGSSRQRVGTR